jgi:diguanylate cyclase (GGDEF)-like protein
MPTAFRFHRRWMEQVHTGLDRFLYGLSAYAIPVIIAAVTIAAFSAWDAHYAETGARPLKFRVLPGKGGDNRQPLQARALLEGWPEVPNHDTHLAETPFWLAIDVKPEAGDVPVMLEFPSRHASAIACWDAKTLRELGQATRQYSAGAVAAIKAGFALTLEHPLAVSQVLCRTNFVGPARISVVQWPASQLQVSDDEFHRNSGLLDGGLIVLAMFMVVTALINRESTYLVFAAWLIANLRVGALSAGWDFQWLGRTVPQDLLQHGRLATIALYYILTLTLFRTLFREELARVGYIALVRAAQWSCLFILPASLLLPYPTFLPIFWAATGLGIAMLVFFLGRILAITHSRVAMWYSASIAITLMASMVEVISAALGVKGLVGAVNSVTAALSSSLLALLAVAAQIRQEHEQRLAAQAELQHNYEAMPIGLFSLDVQGRFLNANPALMAMLGHNVLASERNTWAQHFNDGAWSELHNLVHNQAEGDLEFAGRLRGTGGKHKRFLVKATLSRGKIEGWLQDVTEKSKATEELRFMAIHDPLTKVYNRRGIEKMYELASLHLAEGKPMALAYLDLDRFKLINDLYGHTTGDEVLKQVCERITSMLSTSQYIGRVGGDEFVIVMPDTTMPLAAWVCRGIVGSICTKPYRIGEKAFQVGVSIGLIEVSAGTQIKDALSTADRACREAKGGHHDGLVVYEKHATAFRDRASELQLVERLTAGVVPDGFFLEMQPIMSLKGPYDSLNFEVLLRMHDVDGGVIPAGRIISAAENSGRTAVVDRWVLATTLAWLDKHFDELARTQFVCMNISGASLNDESFVQDAYTMLECNARAASRLCVEITESVALHDLNNTRRFIDKVHSYGVKVALDDFGAGYTSFSYLKELPADVLKIDGSFIVNMNAHPTNVSIVEAIVNLATNLGMKTIAEWAEDAATVQTLAEIGVDYVQGFAVAHAQAPDRLLAVESSAGFINDEQLSAFLRTLSESNATQSELQLFELGQLKKLH